MTRQAFRRTSAQAGFTLAEILVATAVFLIVFLGAMLLYDRSNQVFKIGVENSDLQQNTRVAFDKVVSDIRMAGFDFDRDGRPSGGIALAWRPNTLYGRGAIISPTDPTIAGSMTFRCDVAGKSGGTEPKWLTATYSCLSGSECVNDAAPLVWVKRSSTAEYQQPDEQLEYVGRSAITVRANFNYEDPTTEDNGREPTYEPTKGQFPIVTTSNREIATYALRSDRGANPDTISFYADIRQPRNAFPGGSKEDLVEIKNVDDCMTGTTWDGCTQPPYTLYRITLADDFYTSKRLIETPIASNIRSLRFTYYEDIAGTEALRDLASTPVVIANGGAIGGNGQYDPADGSLIIADRLIRMKIKSIGVELVGMGENPDMNYTNPDETAAAYTDTAGRTVEVGKYRTYRIESLVSPRNIGKHGMREQDILPPGSPKLTELQVGACGILTVKWDPPPTGATYGAVEQYQVEYKKCGGAIPCDLSEPFSGGASPTIDTSYSIADLDPGSQYIFRVKAFNGYGSAVSSDLGFYAAPLNRTKPEAPKSFTAASTTANKIDLTFTRPLTSVSGDYRVVKSGAIVPAGTIPASEITSYEIYRGDAVTYTKADLIPTDAAHLVFNGPLSSDPISGVVQWPDNKITNCTPYFYKVRAVEKCSLSDSYNEGPAPDKSYAVSDFALLASSVASASTATPAAPADLTLKGSNNADGKTYDILLQWPWVTADTTGAPLNTSYEVLRVTKNASGTTLATDTLPVPYSPSSIVSYTDNVAIAKVDASGVGVMLYYEYQVRAVNCTFHSDWTTPPRKWPCAFDPAIVSSFNFAPAPPTPIDGDGMTAPGAWLVSGITGITAGWTGAIAEIHADLYRADGTGTPLDLGTFPSPTSPVTFPIADGLLEDGVTYRVQFTVKDAGGCMAFFERYMQESPSNCCLAPNGFTTVVTRGVGSVVLRFTNLCDVPLKLQTEGIHFSFTDLSSKKSTKLSKVTYGTFVDPVLDGRGSGMGAGVDLKILDSTAVAAGAPTAIAAGGTYTVQLDFTTDSFTFDCATGIYTRPTVLTDTSPHTCNVYSRVGGSCP